MDNNKGKSYKLGIVIFLALLFGIVLLNRFIIDEFKINYAEARALASVLAITWAFSTWFFRGVSDRIGRKIIFIPATLCRRDSKE
jgi:hypothetical protein